MNITELASTFYWWNGISREMVGGFSVFQSELYFVHKGVGGDRG